jgi:hypothetical protein
MSFQLIFSSVQNFCFLLKQCFQKRLFFTNFSQLLDPEKMHFMTLDQLPELNSFFNMKYWGKKFEDRIILALHQRRYLITIRVLYRLFYQPYIFIAFGESFSLVLRIVQFVLLKKIIDNLESGKTEFKKCKIIFCNSNFSSIFFFVLHDFTVSILSLFLILLEVIVCLIDPQLRFWSRCLSIRVEKILSISLYKRFLCCRVPTSIETTNESSTVTNKVNVINVLSVCIFVCRKNSQ